VATKSSAVVHEAIECLGRLSAAFEQRRRQLAQGEGLTEHQWRVLEEISTEHFMPSMFARHRESSAAAVSKTLRQLGDRSLVTVSVSRQDGRQRTYVLTPKGRHTLEELRARREAAIRSVWLGLDPRELESFVRFGNQLTQRLEEYARRADRD
jgi:DNA-binding MarR family transcriptional regulator